MWRGWRRPTPRSVRLMAEIPESGGGSSPTTTRSATSSTDTACASWGRSSRASTSPAEPDPAQLAALADTIRSEGVTAIFSESAVNPRLAQAIADETGARVVDEPLYTDSLGPPGSGADTLDGMLLHDARVIHDALTAASGG